MQHNSYVGYSNAGHGPDLHTLSALLDGTTGTTIPHGDGNLGQDAYQTNMAGGMTDVGVGYGGMDGVGGDVKQPPPRTLPTVLAAYMREQGKAVNEDELCNEVRKVYMELRKPDGTRYTGNLDRAVRGSLCSTGLFEKQGENLWTLREDATRDYERRLRERAAKQEAEKSNKRRRRSDSTQAEGQENGERKKRKYVRRNPAGTRLKRGAKRENILEMLGNFSENLRNQPSWINCFSNPFKSFKGNENEDDVWKKLGNERFVFMLQFFNYLADLLSNRHLIADAIAKEQKAKAKAESGRADGATSGKGRRGGDPVNSDQIVHLGTSLRNLESHIQKLTERLTNVESQHGL